MGSSNFPEKIKTMKLNSNVNHITITDNKLLTSYKIYSETTLNWPREHKVNLIEKHCNPPNCPELCSIERYWAIVKGKLRFKVEETKNIQDFKNKWIRATKKVQLKTMQKLMLSVKRKVHAFSDTQLHKLT